MFSLCNIHVSKNTDFESSNTAMSYMRFLLIQHITFRVTANTGSKNRCAKKKIHIFFSAAQNHQFCFIIFFFFSLQKQRPYVREYVWWKPAFAHFVTPDIQPILSHLFKSPSDLIGIQQLDKIACLVENYARSRSGNYQTGVTSQLLAEKCENMWPVLSEKSHFHDSCSGDLYCKQFEHKCMFKITLEVPLRNGTIVFPSFQSHIRLCPKRTAVPTFQASCCSAQSTVLMFAQVTCKTKGDFDN